MEDKRKDVDKLLNSLFKKEDAYSVFQIKELFQQRLDYLSITKNQACKILDLDNKTLDSFLEGESKKIDFVSILKFSNFLKVPHNILIEKYFDLVQDSYNESIEKAKIRNYIVDHFDLPSLKKIRFIDNITDFDSIEDKIKTFFGYDSIFEHSRNEIKALFSSSKRKTNERNLGFWFAAAKESVEKTPNPYEYDREGLIDYFPTIRWHSMDVENGLMAVGQKLFKLGITLVIVPKYTKDLHIRGATFSHRDKPCIALTQYTPFYSTLWFALIHELFHVLYDWEIILKEKHHFSLDPKTKTDTDKKVFFTDSIEMNEKEADDFARQYLFSDEKMKEVSNHINNKIFIENYARLNHIHPSIIYSIYAWEHDQGKDWARLTKNNPKESYKNLLDNFIVESQFEYTPIKEISRKRSKNLNYNTL